MKKATTAQKSFVRNLNDPEEVLGIISRTQAAIETCDPVEKAKILFLAHREIAEIESHFVADAIIASNAFNPESLKTAA